MKAVDAALQGGVTAVQLREKDLSTGELVGYADRLREVTRKRKALLMVNDRVDVALAVGADGVHLGYASMPVEAVRNISGKEFLIGVSVHSVAQAVNAAGRGADFITCGPVFDTPSKRKYGKPVGVRVVAEAVRSVSLPVFAIGGVKRMNIPEIMKTGVQGVAMISEILGADDIAGRAREIVRLVQ